MSDVFSLGNLLFCGFHNLLAPENAKYQSLAALALGSELQLPSHDQGRYAQHMFCPKIGGPEQ